MEHNWPRFFSKIAFSHTHSYGGTVCWEWTGSRNAYNYGMIGSGFGVKSVKGAHRWVAEALTGLNLPTKTYVCHHCDNPPCVNPQHLWLGTNSENIRDSIAKGRFAPPPDTHANPEWDARRKAAMPRGEKHVFAKYSTADVNAIHALRSTGLGPRPISRQLGLKETFVQDVIYGRARKNG